MEAVVVFFTWLMFTASVALGKKHLQFCGNNEDCPGGECCLGNICTAFLTVGERCNTLTQILSLQCPCEVGSSCITTTQEEKEVSQQEDKSKTMCRSINENKEIEVTEDRDRFHIKSNTIDE